MPTKHDFHCIQDTECLSDYDKTDLMYRNMEQDIDCGAAIKKWFKDPGLDDKLIEQGEKFLMATKSTMPHHDPMPSHTEDDLHAFHDSIVLKSLKESFLYCSYPDDRKLMKAIKRVIKYYSIPSEYKEWLASLGEY